MTHNRESPGDVSGRCRFVTLLAVVTVVGLALRTVAFVDAGRLAYSLAAQPSAQHPPLFALLPAGVTRGMRVSGVLAFWFVVPPAVVGAVATHRRRLMSLAPFLGLCAVGVVAAAAGYGLWRLRLPLDVAAVTLAGVGIVALLDRVRPTSVRPAVADLLS